jgi:hypothetical protein
MGLLTLEFKKIVCRTCRNCNEAALDREDFECRAKNKRIRKVSGVVACSAHELRKRLQK